MPLIGKDQPFWGKLWIDMSVSVPWSTCHVDRVVDGSSRQTNQRGGQGGRLYQLPDVLAGVEDLRGVRGLAQSTSACHQVVLG